MFNAFPSYYGVLDMKARFTPFAPQGPEAGRILRSTLSHSYRHDFICPIEALAEEIKEAKKELRSPTLSAGIYSTSNIFEGKE